MRSFSAQPTRGQNLINFEGRTGYARIAIETGVPIVPILSIGGQETQLFLTRGDRLAKRLGLHWIRQDILPLSVGVPFGMTVFFPANMTLPAKIVDQVLEPIDVVKQLGKEPRRRRGRRTRPLGDADGPRPACPGATVPCAGLTTTNPNLLRRLS